MKEAFVEQHQSLCSKWRNILTSASTTLIAYNLEHQNPEHKGWQPKSAHYISVDPWQNSNIELVDTKAEAGYLDSMSDPGYIKDLPKIYFPKLPQGTYRGFEIQGDSMLPVEPGSIIISSYVEKLADIRDGRTYVVVSKSEGVVYKRVKNQPKEKTLLLISDNEGVQPLYHALQWDRRGMAILRPPQFLRYQTHLQRHAGRQAIGYSEKVSHIYDKIN